MINNWSGISPEEAVQKISKAKTRLDEVEGLITNYSALLKQDPGSFAYKLSIESLRERANFHQEEISQVLSFRKFEIFDFSLNGALFQREAGDLLGLAGFFHFLQQTFASIVQAISAGATNRGRIQSGIQNLSQINLANVFPSSFGLRLAIKTDLDLFGGSYAIQGIHHLFQLVNSVDDKEKLYEKIAFLGPRTLSNFRRLIKHLSKTKSSFHLSWEDPFSTQHQANTSEETISRADVNLSKIKTNQDEFRDFEGFLLGASLIRKRFEFVLDSGEIITGNVPKDQLEFIPHFFGKKCKIRTNENIVTDELGQSKRTSHTLLKIESPKDD